MKKILLAGILLSASTLSIVEANATSSPVHHVQRLALPKNVADAFSAFEAQYAAQGFILTNVQWSHSKNKYTATYLIADMASDNVYDGSASWLANGQRVTGGTGSGTTPE
ncbi:hypothetical protein EPD60_07285 [Flaviaesturariibacter flavus]|uniref:Uncharacterized protein n=1 Tax=Flaviaesturariibacter flavus TaxID=2502780 RepID=A0A4R1BH37_9BACT|nr:hypothetical protein [Flaviaesturariibacter flavus]TCJ16540.1 hypothetical protein EPD60_07285 [Flaviaesturariibacter flavus]